MIARLSLLLVVTTTVSVHGSAVDRQQLTVAVETNTFHDGVDKSAAPEADEDARTRMIFPGTLWCGPGNIAKNESDLGMFAGTDRCCRTHDHCDGILAGETKYGLVNDTPYSK